MAFAKGGTRLQRKQLMHAREPIFMRKQIIPRGRTILGARYRWMARARARARGASRVRGPSKRVRSGQTARCRCAALGAAC
ncbi:hypothetical protein T210_0139940 [Burkholderia pseudomallei MSHR6137]|nr:hypothetical protein T210_0139940 [Burkholderia pseudomallei MSHR6137]